jgi:hypothetical protein
MGDHYIPQYYLRGFCNGFGRRLWVYDKCDARKFPTQVKSVANICGLYPPELEKHLSEEIENPANQVLDKIRNREPITRDDKITLSNYIAVMWKRVPESKTRLKERAPKIAADLRSALHQQIDQALISNPEKDPIAQRRKVEIDEILNRLSHDPPNEIWHQVIPVDRTPRMVASIATMTWRFISYDEKPVFLTSDNPVFHFRSLGIGKAESELSFPVSSHVTLWPTRRLDIPEGYFPTTTAIVKEMNRRIASITTRYVFHAEEEEWILPFLAKKNWKLNRIV